MSYSQLMAGLKVAGCDVDRKVLADLAVRDREGFGDLVKLAKKGWLPRRPDHGHRGLQQAREVRGRPRGGR